MACKYHNHNIGFMSLINFPITPFLARDNACADPGGDPTGPANQVLNQVQTKS